MGLDNVGVGGLGGLGSLSGEDERLKRLDAVLDIVGVCALPTLFLTPSFFFSFFFFGQRTNSASNRKPKDGLVKPASSGCPCAQD